jgi:hypothetical protein
MYKKELHHKIVSFGLQTEKLTELSFFTVCSSVAKANFK